jgi:hypothetical protein
MRRLIFGVILALALNGAELVGRPAAASAPGCGQAQVEKLWGAPAPPGPSTYYILPRGAVTPFYQWESDNGYCGETSLMQAGMSNGQWMSQFNTRLVCGAFFGLESNGYGASLLQAGNPLTSKVNYNAQLLIESPGTGVSGSYDFAYAARCGSNAGLRTTTYPYQTGYQTANTGIAGYRDYMSWVKSQVIAGNVVTLAVLYHGSSDAQYDHEVTVIKIGTNHAPTDSSYYDDDVVYFDDHGAYTLTLSSKGKWAFAWNPSVPYGAGSDATGCTPYVFAYTFAALANTRAGANATGAPGYSIVIPGSASITTGSGNTATNGNGTVTVSGPHNYGFAVSGPLDSQGVTKPVVLTILGTQTLTNGTWTANPWDTNSTPAAGNNYEHPYIGGAVGSCDRGTCVSNTQPAAMRMSLQATVSGLTPGVAYTLYEYDFPTLSGASTGAAAALTVPTSNFNANRAAATVATSFTATGTSWTTGPLSRTSDQIVVFRAVPASAP